MSEKITGSEALCGALLAEGVDTIFGYPGGQIMSFYDTLYGFQDRLHHILTRHSRGPCTLPRAMPVHRAVWVWSL